MSPGIANLPRRMRAARLVLVLAIVILTVPMVGCEASGGQTLKVFDGDSFLMRGEDGSEIEVRLYGIDAPERHQPWSRRSREALYGLIRGRALTLERVETDRYGRAVAKVTREPDGLIVNAEMVRGGNAWVYRRYTRDPALLQAFAGLSGKVFAPGRIEPALKSLVSYVASRAAGCVYCQAHTGHTSHRNGVSEEKLQAAFEFETSPLFDDRERAALRLACHASVVPNATQESDVEALRKHFDDDEIVELVSVIALFGFLNRWNDTMATTLEQSPRSFGEKALGEAGWEAGKHG